MQLLYLDSIDSDELKVERTRPVICYWNSEKIKYRENLEMTIGRFGFGDINPPFVTEDCKQSFVDFGSDFEYNEESIECNLEVKFYLFNLCSSDKIFLLL